MPLRYTIGNSPKANHEHDATINPRGQWKTLEAATWANERAKRIGEKTALLESMNLQAFIENAQGDREKRNYYAKQSNLLRAELLK